MIEIPCHSKKIHKFVYLEDVINFYSQAFFNGYRVLSSLTFRVTRDADLEIDEEESQNLLREMERSLKQRRHGDVVRLEVVESKERDLLAFLLKSLQLSKKMCI